MATKKRTTKKTSSATRTKKTATKKATSDKAIKKVGRRRDRERPTRVNERETHFPFV